MDIVRTEFRDSDPAGLEGYGTLEISYGNRNRNRTEGNHGGKERIARSIDVGIAHQKVSFFGVNKKAKCQSSVFPAFQKESAEHKIKC
jgi:hypothetical protein